MNSNTMISAKLVLWAPVPLKNVFDIMILWAYQTRTRIPHDGYVEYMLWDLASTNKMFST